MKIGRSKIIPTAFSPQVAERRRLLLSPDRLEVGGSVLLNTEEQHYLRRVLRLRCGEQVDVTDGCGRLTLSQPWWNLSCLRSTGQRSRLSPWHNLSWA